MKLKREGYTFGAGALVGLMASNRPLYIFAAGLVAGAMLAGSFYFYGQLRAGLRSLRSRHVPGLSAAPTPVYNTRPKREEVPF